MPNRNEKQWVNLSKGKSELYGVNIGNYPEHHFHILPEPVDAEHYPLYVANCGYDLMCKGVYRERKNCDVTSFELVTEGEMRYVCDGTEYICQPDDLFILHLHSNNRMECLSSTAKFHNVGFEGVMLPDILEKLRLDNVNFIRLKNAAFIFDYFQKIYDDSATYQPSKLPHLASAGYELLLQLSNLLDQTSNLPPVMDKVLGYINKHIGEKLQICDVANYMNVSQGTIFGLFRQHMKISPIEYLVQQKIAYAKRLLLQTSYPIKEISAMCGYCNQLYFSQAFRQRTGMSPSDYREKTLLTSEDRRDASHRGSNQDT